ncbi:restriction endonuclease subunit S [Thalassorhabdomicrobium marinisediminis]|uniref:Restriction endonuclease subunit S n=1 Tax=Thalassorhabdomicrobium marinisediminis TaxID=2170577 RepID=A0A2T7FSW5_9RHOB|nr:restriction endonuclease subunit S [Thalassorhabdomicrobium marinisediminis]PVA05267.1 restriction endonuclease subunit S [Thalassorhabdomicrobium marinisediminis]
MNEILLAERQEGWNLYRLGQVLEERKQKASDKDYEALSVTMQGIVPQLETAAKTDDGDNRKLVRKGDYVINSRSDRKGSGGISPLDGTVSLISIVLQPRKDLYPAFAHHLLRSVAFQEEFYRVGHGIVADLWTTRYAEMKNIRFYLPDLPTQKRIAAFLDRETARIDELIAKKERLGGLIDQRRLAVITAAVTGKIGPASETPTKSDATENQVRLRFMLQVAPSAGEVENLSADDEVTFAPMDALGDGLGGLDVSGSRPLAEVAAGSYNYFRDGDILLAKVTPCFENGKKALAHDLINGVGFATSEVHVFRPKPGKLDHRFLMYLFSSEDFRADGMKSMTGAGGLKRVSDAAILNYRPHVTDVALQQKVADFLDLEMEVFEVIKERTKESIDRLREYRAALITAAVTGQIDVDTYGRTGTTSATLDQIEEEMQA